MATWAVLFAVLAWALWPSPKAEPPALSLPSKQPSGHEAALLRMRRVLAAEERLTPELKAAFEAISAALKEAHLS